MNFLKLLQSLDELLYEVMSWLIFYPVTLWRTLRHPWRMMDYADAELDDAPARQYADTLSPPLFLFLSLILAHAVELAVVGESYIVADTHGLHELIDSDTNLIALRIAIFAMFPLLLAVRLVRRRQVGLTRNTLRPPFYSQCYVTAPFALVIGLAGNFLQIGVPWGVPIGAGMIAVALLWFGSLQSRWFAEHLGTSRARGWVDASLGMVEATIAALALAALFA